MTGYGAFETIHIGLSSSVYDAPPSGAMEYRAACESSRIARQHQRSSSSARRRSKQRFNCIFRQLNTPSEGR